MKAYRGSSPLTRGKRQPARLHDRLGVAHPRSRGENTMARAIDAEPPGSSPLTRGKPAQVIERCASLGLIPAHAGKTTACSPASSTRRAHPRSRGENIHAPTSAPSGYGSSPLTRGKRRKGGRS